MKGIWQMQVIEEEEESVANTEAQIPVSMAHGTVSSQRRRRCLYQRYVRKPLTTLKIIPQFFFFSYTTHQYIYSLSEFRFCYSDNSL